MDRPTAGAKLPVMYRDFEVDEHYITAGFQWVHKDYDGDEDKRAGHEWTLEACYDAIDDFLDE